MKLRKLGKTNALVSEIAMGCWQLGGKWGDPFDAELAEKTLKAATDQKINCFDTADVYIGGESERAIGRYMKVSGEHPFVITKIGRWLNPHVKEGYNEENLRRFIDQSRKNLQVDSLDMVLLHCPPNEVYYTPEVFEILDAIKKEGKIKHYGVSVQKVEEAMIALEYPGVEAIEIIFNMFRLRPAELFFNEAKKKNVGVIVRVPLASGLLTGKFSTNTTFGKDDHRMSNRQGEWFDRGETFSGVDYDTGLQAVEELKKVFPDQSLPMIALRWILMFDAVSTIIPGASRPEHIINNAKAVDLPPLTKEQMTQVRHIYDTYIKEQVHTRW
ncbi:MAG: aldo/keto reductase [Acholeplasma sp.]|jgi:aryl-alcohol dehydrogenase-like predicted oxidoreductase|nr:MAG: aldo/keto reductase [Acholeplasma sp.]